MTDDSVDITRDFVYKCIDSYFEEHHKRDKWIRGAKEPEKKKSGGLDLQTLLGIAGVSLMPVLAKMSKEGGTLSQLFGGQNKEPNIHAPNFKKHDSTMERPTRAAAEDVEGGENNIKYEKV